MKVAIAFPGCHRRGGVERVMLECTNFLSQRGHEVHAFASNWDADALHPGISRHQVSASARLYPVRLSAFIRRSACAIRALAPPPDVLAGFGIETPLNGVVWMQSVHRAWLEISAERRGLSGRLRQRLNPSHAVILSLERRQLAGRRYRKVIALSDQVKVDVIRYYSVPERDIVVIPNGFSPAEFSVEARSSHRARTRAALRLGNTDRAIVFVANELERKGFYPLARAIAMLNDSSLHLIAVGRLDSSAYAGEIERLGLTGRVHWTGPTSAAAEFYAAGDLFALPTQYEAWGLVIVEALACGLPVVTSRLAGASIAVREGETGILLNDPDDSSEIASGLSRALGLGSDAEAISKSVADYQWNIVLMRYEAVLKEARN